MMMSSSEDPPHSSSPFQDKIATVTSSVVLTPASSKTVTTLSSREKHIQKGRRLISTSPSAVTINEDDKRCKTLTAVPTETSPSPSGPGGPGPGLGSALPSIPTTPKQGAAGKASTSSGSGQGSTPKISVPHTPLSERQQLALLLQMTADSDDSTNKGPLSPLASTLPNKKLTPMDKKVNKRNERGETALHVAAIRGDVKQTKKLIKSGAEVNVRDFAGWTPLHEACNHGWVSVTKCLLKAGAEVNVQGLDNDSPLHDASINGHCKLVDLLIRHGANPLQANSESKTPLDVAANAKITRLLKREITTSSNPSDSSSQGDARSPLSVDSILSEKDDTQLDAGKQSTDKINPSSPRLTMKFKSKDEGQHRMGSSPCVSYSVVIDPDSDTGPDLGPFKSQSCLGNESSIAGPSVVTDSTFTVGETSDPSMAAIKQTSVMMHTTCEDVNVSVLMRNERKGSNKGAVSTVTGTGPGDAMKTAGLGLAFTATAVDKPIQTNVTKSLPKPLEIQPFSPAFSDISDSDSDMGGKLPLLPIGDFVNAKSDRSDSANSHHSNRIKPCDLALSQKLDNWNDSMEESIKMGEKRKWPDHTRLDILKDNKKSKMSEGSVMSDRTEKVVEKLHKKSPNDEKDGEVYHVTVTPKDHHDSYNSKPSSLSKSDLMSLCKDSRSQSPKVPPLKIIIPPRTSPSSDKGTDGLKKLLMKPALPYVLNPTRAQDQSQGPGQALDQESGVGLTATVTATAAYCQGDNTGTQLNNTNQTQDEAKRVDDVDYSVKMINDSHKSQSDLNKNNRDEDKKPQKSTRTLRSHTAAQQQNATSNNDSQNGNKSNGQPEEIYIHPRKRKLRQRAVEQTVAVPAPEPAPVLALAPLVQLEKPENPYKLYLDIRKQVAERQKQLNIIQPKPPDSYKDYLMVSKKYILADKKAGRLSVPQLIPPNSMEGAMRELFLSQEKERYKLRLQQLIEREKLVLSIEQEMVRVHGRAARVMANQSMPLSVCTILKDSEIYSTHQLESPQTITEDKESKGGRSRYNGRQFLSWIQDVEDKYSRIKESLIMRHHHEAESLNAVQKLDWEWKLKAQGLCDYRSTPSIDDLHVPMVFVSDDFDLLPQAHT